MAEDLPDEFDVVVIGTGNVNLYTSKLLLSFVTYNMNYVTIFLTDWSVYGPCDHFNFSYSMSVRYQGRIYIYADRDITWSDDHGIPLWSVKYIHNN